uniref:RING-type domain-containing protein n=1 Tax=Opuntia streptacantha TaxID=393608 RepID=A0A7C9CTF9_OPUST
MGVNFLVISAVCTVVSLIGMQCWTEISLEKFKVDRQLSINTLYTDNANHIIELLLHSHTTITLLVLCVVNVFGLLILSLKTVFFGELFAAEARKLVERLVNYIVYKGTFLPLIIPPTIFHAGLWLTWLTVLCFLKMFQALARDRLERLNASPSVTPWTYFRVYSALLLVFVVDCLWMWFCTALSGALVSSTYWLLFFEPLSIAFETLQAILVHGFQLMDVWLHHSAAENSDCQRSKIFNTSTAGSLWEWKSSIVRNLGFFLDMMTLLMALGHYVLIWWLHGMAFHLIDAILFLNIRALLSAIVKRIKGFIKLRTALGALHDALPDATSEEIQVYDDECAICREPMAKAKKLPCNHLFHLACLRSWLDQGLSEIYSCPTCRKPLFVGRPDTEMSSHNRAVSSDELLARQLSSGLDQQNAAGHEGAFTNPGSLEANGWREAGAESSWLQPWRSQGLDGAGPSNAVRSVGLGRVQMMMRHLASVRDTYAQTALEDTSWSLWPASNSQATTSRNAFPPVVPGHRLPISPALRTASHTANDSIANLLAMAETVREVLPHIPDDIILRDLQRTHNVAVTVNNLLQM